MERTRVPRYPCCRGIPPSAAFRIEADQRVWPRRTDGLGHAPAPRRQGPRRALASVSSTVTELVHLSVLDQSPVAEGATGSEALHNTIDLARLADGLGYHRYWVAEHHGGPSLAGPSPEVLIGPIAAATTRLRVGSGGVMLPHY